MIEMIFELPLFFKPKVFS